jgi:hypothetical protein
MRNRPADSPAGNPESKATTSFPVCILQTTNSPEQTFDPARTAWISGLRGPSRPVERDPPQERPSPIDPIDADIHFGGNFIPVRSGCSFFRLPWDSNATFAGQWLKHDCEIV